MRVVIVEDEAIIRMDLREILQEHGCEIVGEAKTGSEALELVRKTRPDCVFMDIQMSGYDGLDAAKAICAENVSAVVMLTAFSQDAFVKEAAEVGVMAYLSKPFTEADIMPALRIAVSRFEQTCALATEVDDLEMRLQTRKVVEQAKGILMEAGMTEDEAFKRLRKVAMDERKPMGEIAQSVITAYRLGKT